MRISMKRAFRPGCERVEDRFLATGGMAGPHAFTSPHALVPFVAHHAVGAAFSPPPSPIKGGLGHGLIRLALPFNFQDYGVITLWNNTTTTVNFQVSASTFGNGAFYPFTLRSGQHQ